LGASANSKWKIRAISKTGECMKLLLLLLLLLNRKPEEKKKSK